MSTQMFYQLPLFPLPNVVLLPDMPLPLHIFEPRYQTMLQDVMRHNKQFGLVQYHRGYSTDDNSTLAISSVGTVAKVVDVVSQHPDYQGRSNIVVIGQERFSLSQINTKERPYYTATVSTFEDRLEPEANTLSQEQEDQLIDLFQSLITLNTKLEGHPAPNIPLPASAEESLTFAIGKFILWDPDFQQQLLESQSEQERYSITENVLQKLVRKMAAATAIESAFAGMNSVDPDLK